MRDPKGGLAPDAHRHAWALEETEWRRARDIDCVVQVQIHMSLVDNVIQEQQRGAPVRGFGHPAAARSRQDSPSLEFVQQRDVSNRGNNLIAVVLQHPPDAPACSHLSIEGVAQPQVAPCFVALGPESVTEFKPRNYEAGSHRWRSEGNTSELHSREHSVSRVHMTKTN